MHSTRDCITGSNRCWLHPTHTRACVCVPGEGGREGGQHRPREDPLISRNKHRTLTSTSSTTTLGAVGDTGGEAGWIDTAMLSLFGDHTAYPTSPPAGSAQCISTQLAVPPPPYWQSSPVRQTGLVTWGYTCKVRVRVRVRVSELRLS
jgi:hypothetical protein